MAMAVEKNSTRTVGASPCDYDHGYGYLKNQAHAKQQARLSTDICL
eukprot:CAMPEP_0204340022 /NCGR_PEP_ID=MMETSP0469-20131031/22255_1 /ASSEMBLY_ACC=CAM_ASM_000384 /TAXON_ID=2969 /ORGANISM="Oxyrrhis marina" /LENGTH=45 /DNA_ID= /DNA_START= /DNA_END= /DNA_ORIENTATION=